MENLQTITGEFYAALDSQNWSAVERLMAPDFVASVGDRSPMGLAEWRQQLDAFHEGFPDGRHVIDEYVVGDDAVVTRCRFVGTHTGAFQQIAPTGRSVSAGVIHIDHFERGTISQHFGQLNMLGLLNQLEPERG
jgi:predicted ester cyclase